ncbi:MAG: sulfatase-like hydrolase/transferase [Lewinellaceae bacterium]|nr:sulfatase-like hydrolase/transferase [Saprospiraceae bacterium]MCB9336677.1 sulfatase-like hydrolase/transferase [Lewinellaceae bacterium]
MAELTIDLGKERPLPGILPKQLTYVLGIYLAGLVCFTIFRLILFVQEFHQLHYLPTDQGVILVLKAFLMGLRFDTVVSGYILTLPFLVLTADAMLGLNNRLLYHIVVAMTTAGYAFGFFACAVDLPYFHHFYTRLTMSVMISANSGNSSLPSTMVLQEWRYFWAFLPFTILTWFFFVRNRRLMKNVLYRSDGFSFASSFKSFVVFGLLLFFGIWNRFSLQSHIDAGTAYFSDYGFTNMLGLSPVYTFGLSYVNSFNDAKQEVNFMGDGEAIRHVQQNFQIPAAQEFNSPIARQVVYADTVAAKPNVVLVIMESMSANKMGRYGNRENLTPFMDSLAEKGYVFDSIFTSGIHTFAGIYSTLFAQPVVKRQHPMRKLSHQSGFANTLKEHGYSTVYFTTHDAEFDNVGPFLQANGFDRIVSNTEYPKEKILSALGVPDDYLYEHAIGDINEISQEGKPFLAAIMTGSDHGPYLIPKYFKPNHKDATLGVVEYVDWSVQRFLDMAGQQPWFDNTIFVFVADHGAALDKRYDMCLSYVHTPLIIYAPKLLGPPRQLEHIGSQLDVFPTVMGLLKLPYVNNTFGIDLLNEKRSFATAYADDKFAVFSTEYMFVARENGVKSLYHYRSGDLTNHIDSLPNLAREMETYGQSIFQAAQWLKKNRKTGMQELQ